MLKSFAGGRVFGATWGHGAATVLALHGWQRTHQDFSPVFDPVHEESVLLVGPNHQHRDGLSVVAPDLFGFGATPPPPEAWGSREYAGHLRALFDEPGILAERVVVVAHSFGGRVAIPLYDLVPDRIERLVLTGVPLLDREGRRTRTATRYRLARRLHKMGVVGDGRMEALRNKYGSPDYRAAKGIMRDVFVRLLSEQYAEGMAAVDCPVDLFWGEEDTEVPVEVAERAVTLFPSARLVLAPGIGHLTPTEAPRELLEVILGGSE